MKFKGMKVLEVNDDCLLGVKGYSLVKYDFLQKKIIPYAKVIDNKYAPLSKFYLLRRLLRAEITGLYTLSDGTQLVIAKKGIFRKEKNDDSFIKTFAVLRGSRPLNLCIASDGKIYFGEYFANMEKKAVRIFLSEDNGRVWTVACTIDAGRINHIHGLFWDKYTKRLWICTGDREGECIIGYTEDGFQTLVEVFRGGQEYRTCHLFFYEQYIVFATDSEYTENEIKFFDRETLQIDVLQKIQGTAIKGGQCGEIAFISTTVEPSKINKDTFSHLWITKDGLNWEEVYKAEKDILPHIFQFGSIEFPRYRISKPLKKLFFSGRALKDIDGCSLSIDI